MAAMGSNAAEHAPHIITQLLRDWRITPERPEDSEAIETLLDLAFGGPDRRRKRSYHYREGIAPDPHLRLVARGPEGALLGTIRYWPILIGAEPAHLLGPIAVLPELKGLGVGKALMRHSLNMAHWARYPMVVLVGDLEYYGQFGFAPAAPHGISMPGEDPRRLLALPLEPALLPQFRGAIARWPGGDCARGARGHIVPGNETPFSDGP